MRHVDQFLFGFRSGEMGVVSSSLAHDFRAECVWADRLTRHARVQPSQLGDRSYAPATSWSYLEFGNGEAALLRRSNGAEAGRNHAHALVGAAVDLHSNAHALWQWPGWLDAPGPVAPTRLAVADLIAERDGTSAGFDRRCAAHENLVVPLVRAVLADPSVRLSVVAAPEEAVPDLVWLLRRIAEPFSSVARTFSTYEYSDDRAVPDLPGVVFLPTTPSAGETEHRRVFLTDTPPPDDPTWTAARALVKRYLSVATAGRSDEYRTWLVRQVAEEPDERAAAARLVTALAGRSTAPAPAPVRHRDEVDRVPTTRRPPDPVRNTKRGKAVPVRNRADLGDPGLVEAIARDDGTAAVADLLEEMSHRIGWVRDRRKVREALYRNDFLIEALAAALPGNSLGQWRAFRVVLEFGYGPDGADLARRGHLTALHRHVVPGPDNNVFPHVVREFAIRHGRGREFDELLGWETRRRYPVPPELGATAAVPPLAAYVRPRAPGPPRGAVALRYRWDSFVTTPLGNQVALVALVAAALLAAGFIAGWSL
ncbi:hypothetical protein FHS29_006204 [Saccharothrix tamanrassetensis]|uniref:Uncharacterized protein n=1 Tax=Saccharothrix tamanrassetensis TaxID=1051531 RepID=A0A841CRT5_9PSEU|nr:hypothetical protein [Saccharothrix tamanrassetensis]MBB5959583.1 hypothetical protein [Saccharothrix tamanrassetensis]